MLTTLIRAVLCFAGVTTLLGAVWFVGSPGSYAGLLAGVGMLGWAVMWNACGRTQLVSAALLLMSVVATAWVATTRLTSDPEAAPLALLLVLVVLVSAGIWVRQRAWP